ncbi:MAG TPA: UDP-N-acetylmuramoyl-L-alanine--D-glutamate ligase, partial [Lachnospiraceae bacterium]|nr:UDP-N-acetylmuramoyl-L-alanine--D-glutamate ligase [Lachnospiraceae bacterium]
QALRTYQPLPHRLSLIGEKKGVRYYDDSISTICDTTIQALKSVPNVGTVLIGGMDRGIEYGELIEFLSENQVPHIILMADTGKRIYHEILTNYPDFSGPERLILVDTLEEAVRQAEKITTPGTACVLSPAA